MPDLEAAVALMDRFAERSRIGRTGTVRYLWTDAFAVCNLLGLADARRDPELTRLARLLVDDVHHTLGRHRGDDGRHGWLSGLPDQEAERHPTAGGLRIGKPLPERRPDEPADPRREWDQDGQYFHYLTRWMHALARMAAHTGENRYLAWGRELAAATVRAFSYRPDASSAPRLCWKMSIDLSRPLVPGMGHHDPLDGYVTLSTLQHAGAQDAAGPDLGGEIESLAEMIQGGDWTTDDALGLGGLLLDVHRLVLLAQAGAAIPAGLLASLVTDAERGLSYLIHQQPWQRPATRRLGFRELGLAIGLEGIGAALHQARQGGHRASAKLLEQLAAEAPLAERITTFWLDRSHRQQPSWTEHQDINDVMLATALAPAGYLGGAAD